MNAVPLTMSEASWMDLVIDTARRLGWMCAHFRPAQVRNGRWVTPMQGDVGFPDLVMSKAGFVLIVELKRQNGRLSPGQRDWLASLGGNGRCWRPSDWPEVVDTLRRAA